MSTLKESDVVVKTVVGEVKNTLVRGGRGLVAHISHTCCGKTISLDFEEKCKECGGVSPPRSAFFSQQIKAVEISRPIGWGGFEDASA